MSSTTFCPTCGGTGFTDIENGKNRAKCGDCQGNGVFVNQVDAVYFFGASSFFDFAKREKAKTLKVIYGGLLVLFFILVFFAAYFLFSMGQEMITKFKV